MGRAVTVEFRADLVTVTEHYQCDEDEIAQIKRMVRTLDDDRFAAMVECFRAMAHGIAPASRWPTISPEEVAAMRSPYEKDKEKRR